MDSSYRRPRTHDPSSAAGGQAQAGVSYMRELNVIEEGAAPEPGLRMARIIGAVLVNAIPVFGVLFGGWSAFALMLLYWLENVIIGVFNVARMIASGVAQGPGGVAACL
ncbi:MAG: DUF6498-containing protein, partial [Pseudomonadota bacterium]